MRSDHGQTVSYEHEPEQVLAAAQSRVPESPVPATSGSAENKTLSGPEFVVSSCATIYSMWYPVVETGDAGESIEPEESH